MAINNPKMFESSFVDYGPLERECTSLGTTMRFSDVDQERERHYRWLRLEWKAPGVKIPDGQTYNFDHLAYLPFTTIVIVWGAEGIPAAFQVVGQMAEPMPCTLRDLARLCLDWEAWAMARPKPEVVTEYGVVTVRTTPPWVWRG